MLNIKNSELIGKEITIVNSSDKSKIGIFGVVIYQTKDELKIRNIKIFTIKFGEIIKFKVKSYGN
jgi:RNase P/RNase MRP subunit p29